MHLSAANVPHQKMNYNVNSSPTLVDTHEKSKNRKEQQEPLEKTLFDTHLQDVGLNPPSFYNKRLSPIVSIIRNSLLPFITLELPLLEYIQTFHNYWLTLYFLYTANFGSHTFYVIMLPLPVWFGSINLTRDLVLVLGLGIYFTGAVKDLLCLPRPSSPPLKRLTMSHYTSKEYGCPSSHSANATSVCIILFLHIHSNPYFDNNPYFKYSIYSFLSLYWFTMILGRLYCGMHGLLDITLGTLIGIFTVCFRLFFKNNWDYLLLAPATSTAFESYTTYLIPLFFISIYYSSIYFHPTPIEPCPCFEDSNAFIAVLLGLDITYWSFQGSPSSSSITLYQLYQNHPSKIPYDYSKLGVTLTLLRIVTGVLLVVIWKFISKPLFTSLINNLRSIKPSSNPCFAFIPRNDTKILVKFIVYSGIPLVAVYAKYIFELLNI